IWSMLLAIMTILSAMVQTACSGDDDDNDTGGNNGDKNTEIKGDYTATTNVKVVTLKEYHNRNQGNVTIYEDLNYKYDLALYIGEMVFSPYSRKNGVWIENKYSDDGHYNIAMQDIGKVNSISDISEKAIESLTDYNSYSLAAQSGHGYIAGFLTENGTQYLRLYISNSRFDNNGALESITVQYQLY
nr:hypothetical protein [Prevotella sp.]